MTAKSSQVLLKSSDRKSLPGAKLIGPATAVEQIQVTVRIRRGSKTGEFPSDAELGSNRPAQRNYLTREEFAAKHGARAEDVAAIRAFASANGLKVASVEAARRTVILGGTVGAFNKAFGTEQHLYSYRGHNYRCRTGALKIPAELEGVIEGVFGLDNRPQARPHFRRRVRAAAADVSFTALKVAEAYDFPSGADGSGQSIAILELGGGYRAQDLSAYFSNLGLTTPAVSAISVDGGSNSPTGSADGPDGEVELDIEIVGAIAP
jgi:kumamolisin